MEKLKTAGNVCLVILAILASIVSITYGFYCIFVNDVTIGVNNISDQVAIDIVAESELTDAEIADYEERWFMEANYYSNDKNNGIQLEELNFNYFTTHELTSDGYRSSGMQFVGDYEGYVGATTSNSDVVKEMWYYDTVDGISFNGYSGKNTQSVSTLLNRDQQFIIKIDGRPFTIQLTGQYLKSKFLWWEIWYSYDYGDVFEVVFDAIESNSAGYGDYYITLDLSYFFSIREMDAQTGKFIADNVTDIIKNYAVLKFHYDENGASRSSQSMFGRIENNAVVGEYETDYWQERMVYTLTEKDLEYRYSESYNGYFVSLSMDMRKFFNDMPRTKLILDFNFTALWLEEKDYVIVGFDYNAFEDFDIDTMTIKRAPGTMYVMEDAFKDAKLKTLKYSNGIVFDGLNVDCEVEVI